MIFIQACDMKNEFDFLINRRLIKSFRNIK